MDTSNVKLWDIPEGEVAKITQRGLINPNYTRLEYIQNTYGYTTPLNTQIPCNTKYTYTVRFKPITYSSGTQSEIFGSTGYTKPIYQFLVRGSGYYNGKYCFFAGNGDEWTYYNLNNSLVLNQEISVKLAPDGVYINGSKIYNLSLTPYTVGTFTLFNTNVLCYQVSTVQIQDENLNDVFYGLPARRNSDNQCGLFDRVSQNFFLPTANQQYITGGNPQLDNVIWSRVPTAYFAQYTYLQSDGNPYCEVQDIDITSTTAIEIKGQWYANNLGGYRKMFGNSSLFMFGKTGNQKLCWSFNGNTYETPNVAFNTENFFVSRFVPNDGLYWNGTKYQDLTNVTFSPDTPTPFYVFDYNPNTTGSELRANLRIAYIKMWDTANPDVLTHYLIPVQYISDNAYALVDIMTGTVYKNVKSSVTTSFSVGTQL